MKASLTREPTRAGEVQEAAFVLDEGAFRAAYETHARAVYRYAVARVGHDVAEDVVGEVFETAWRVRASYDPSRGSVKPWLLGIATNVLARQRKAEGAWRRKNLEIARHASTEAQQAGTEPVHEQVEIAARFALVRRHLMELPRRERVPLLLHVLDEMPYEDIAQVLNLPAGTVRSRISRGRVRLNNALANHGD